jgi:hypothetical protein
MHLDDDGIQRLIHGEIREEDEAWVEEHLTSCPTCARLADEAREEDGRILELFRELDHPAPPASAPKIDPRTLRRPVRWAAAVVGLLGVSTAAYAAPGSPFPGWVRQLVEMLATAPQPPKSTPPGAATTTSGISVAAGSSLSLTFTSADWVGSLLISVEEVSEVAVEAVGIGASFTTDTGLLRVEPEGTNGQFRIRIPLDAPRVEVLLGAEIVFGKYGNVIRTEAPTDDLGRYRIDLPWTPQGD